MFSCAANVKPIRRTSAALRSCKRSNTVRAPPTHESDLTETTQEQSAATPPRMGNSLLATRAANTVRYSMMNLFILFGTVGMALGGVFTWTGMIFSFVLFGYVDELFGDAGDKEAMPPV